MPQATPKAGLTLEVHQITADAYQVQTQYGTVTAQRGSWVVYMPGEMQSPLVMPDDVFAQLFDVAPDAAPDQSTTTAPPPDATAPTTGTPAPDAAAPSTGQPAAAPSPEDVSAWIVGHYAERYRAGVATRLANRPGRAAELLARHPLPADPANPPPPPEQI